MSNRGVRSGKGRAGDKHAPAEGIDHQSLQRAYDHSPVATLCADASGVINYSNNAALAIWGLEAGDIVGKTLFEFCEDPDPAKSNEALLKKGEEFTDKQFKIKVSAWTKWALISSCVYRPDADHTSTYLFIRDISGLKKKEDLFSYLNKASTALAKIRDTPTALKQIAQFIVPTFATWFTVDTIRDNHLELILLEHEDPGKIEWAYRYRKNYPADLNSNTGPAIVIKTGQPGFVPVVTEQMIDLVVPDPVQRAEVKKIGMHSVIMAPMWKDGKVSGLVNFISSRPDNHFDEEDLAFALNFANLISLSLENTRLNEEAANEIALRKESEERFRFLLDAIPHKMWTSGPDGRATYYNQQWHDYTGIEGFEILREKIWDFIHPDDLVEAQILWPKAIKDGTEMEMEHRLLRYDGAYRWHLSRFTAHKREEGQVTLWVGTSTDIHEQKTFEIEIAAANEEIAATNEELTSANEELEAANEEQAATNEELMQTQANLQKTINDLEISEGRFRFLLNAIPQQVWTATPEGRLNYVNDVVCSNFGLPSTEIVKGGPERFIHPADLPSYTAKWQHSVETGEEFQAELRLMFSDDIYRWHLMRALPLTEDGQILLWVGTNTDIDLQKDNEQKRDEFISIVSHELKTPLTSIKAFNQLLQRVKDPEKLEPFVKKSSDYVNRLERLINDLLDVTRINAGKMTYVMEEFDFGKLIEEAAESARLTLPGYEIVLENNTHIRYTGDHYRLEQVVSNLVSNAAKYSAKGSQIIVRSDIDHDSILVTVKDSGIGIAQENIEKLFERFYRIDASSIHYDGLGLGLFISSEIVKRHSGEIWAESELGKGSAFCFRLPLA
ncbi:MAG TPA: PAS domain S-box protein [Mucilaginibacter sp.]|nr:PAS domain S-box protein [Mucilaginibacter sp.]